MTGWTRCTLAVPDRFGTVRAERCSYLNRVVVIWRDAAGYRWQATTPAGRWTGRADSRAAALRQAVWS